MSDDAKIGNGESPQVRAGAILLAAAMVLCMVALVGFGFELLFPDRFGITAVIRHAFPEPAVAPSERAQRLALEAAQKQELDGAHGRKPIDAAMRDIAAKGMRAFDPVGSTP